MRIKIEKLAGALEGLAEHGPLKPEALRGLTMPETIEPAIETLPADQKKWAKAEPNMTQRLNPDPTGYRMGVAPMVEIADKLKQAATDARNYISKDKAKNKENLDIKVMEDHINLMRGAIMIAYPAFYGIPEWDPVHILLESKASIPAIWPDVEWLEPADSVAWFCGRELQRGKTLENQVSSSSNEKSTLIIKIDKKGGGAPVRESPIDEKTQKDMMAFYYKKQEEMKKLEGEPDDVYSNSAWANPNALKSNLITGTKDVKFKYR